MAKVYELQSQHFHSGDWVVENTGPYDNMFSLLTIRAEEHPKVTWRIVWVMTAVPASKDRDLPTPNIEVNYHAGIQDEDMADLMIFDERMQELLEAVETLDQGNLS
jgi:hypothetical protein